MNYVNAGIKGTREPRHKSVPAYDYSSGQDVIDLAESCGLTLDPWQCDVLTDSLGEKNGKWSAMETGVIVPRQNGKNAILEARELAGLFLFDERLILHSAHEFKTAREAFLRIQYLLDNNSELKKHVKAVLTAAGNESINLKNGARLRFVARSGGSGRGFSGDTVILDEAYALKPEAVAALIPALSARPNPQIWYTSSAPWPESLALRRIAKRGRKGIDPRLAYFEWCAKDGMRADDSYVKTEQYLLDIADANPSLGITRSNGSGLKLDFIETERGVMEEELFLRERGGIWEADDSAEYLIDLKLWKALAEPQSQTQSPYVFAVDMKPDRSFTSIAVCAACDGDDMPHVEVIEHRAGTHWIVDACKTLVDKFQPNAFVLDPSSAAGALIPDFDKAGIKTDPKSSDTLLDCVTTRELTQACGDIYDSIVNGKLRHIDQVNLNRAITGATKRNVGDAWAFDRKTSQDDICPLVAVTLAFHGWKIHAENGFNVWAVYA